MKYVLGLIGFVAVGGAVAYQMLGSKSDCDRALYDLAVSKEAGPDVIEGLKLEAQKACGKSAAQAQVIDAILSGTK